MQEYKVYDVDEKTTQGGKTLKKLTLQREGAQYPTKNVTLWNDHPDYASYVPGATVICDILEKDSGTPNPHAPGKNYINRTVAKPGEYSPSQVQGMRDNTDITQKLDAILASLKDIGEKVGLEAKPDEVIDPLNDSEAVPF